MEDNKMGATSVAEVMEEDENRAKRTLVQLAAGALVGVGLIFTGYLSFMLYSRAFPDTLKILGLIPALLIEGSLAVFMLGSFVWFAHGVQGTLAKICGWLMFAIVALNCVVEFNALVGTEGANNQFLQLYSFWGVPVVIPITIAFWKGVIDADPSIQIMRQKRKIQQSLQVAKMQALMVSLGQEDSRQALGMYGNRGAAEINRRLRGELPAGEVVEISRPLDSQPARQAKNPPKQSQSSE